MFDDGEDKLLERMDEKADDLCEKEKYLEALTIMEKALVLRHSTYGKDSTQLWKACSKMAAVCNLYAMRLLNADKFEMTMELLKKAEVLCERDRKGQATTFNNLAVYYRRQGKVHAAMAYIQKALDLEVEMKLPTAADTHLNMCAVLSQVGRHVTAIGHAQEALILLQSELYQRKREGAKDPSVKTDERVAVLAIAYYNIGVEQEHMKKYLQARRSYEKGLKIAIKHLGPNHGIVATLRQSVAHTSSISNSLSLPPVHLRKGRR